MKTYKYSILVIVVVVGSEVILKCLRHAYSLLHHESNDSVQNPQTSCHAEKQRTVNRVIFFPDQGILARMTAGKEDSIVTGEYLDNQHRDSHEDLHMSRPIARPFSSSENRVPRSTYLRRSTSLIHLVNALDSAQHSLKVCVYVITLQDMVEAVVRAKNRGVFVRVMVEGQMPNEAALLTLRKNNIPVRISRTSQLLHHKFTLVDVPEPHHQTLAPDKTVVAQQSAVIANILVSWLD